MSRPAKFLIVFSLVILPISLLINVLMYLRYSPRRPLVIVGSHKISKYDYERALDQQAGKQVLNQMVFAELINQAATRASLVPTEAQVHARLAEIKRLTPQAFQTTLTQAASDKGESELRTQIEMENLRVQNIRASDAEIAEFYNSHKAIFTATPQTVSILVLTDKPQDAASAEHLLSLGLTPPAIARQPGMHVNGVNGFSINMQMTPVPLQRKMQAFLSGMKTNAVKTFSSGPFFLTFKVMGHQPGHVTPLSEVRDLIARQVRLQKAPDNDTELAQLYQREQPQILNARYSAYFQDIQQARIPAVPPGEKRASFP